MDALIAASARLLASGDALGALRHVALRDDPSALALRGIAMAQLGEHARARELLRRAARAFGTREALAHARCVVAEAEVALAMRDLGGSPRALSAARATLETRGDVANARQARLVAVRRFLLLGRLDDAATELDMLPPQGLSPSLTAVAELARAELALRSLRIDATRTALARAQEASDRARLPALQAEIADAQAALERPAARRVAANDEETLSVGDVATILRSGDLVVDGCRRGLQAGATWVPLARRPVLFSLARELATSWPGDADRNALIASAFRTRRPDETHRARLRVEMGRLRALVTGIATIDATARGFVLTPRPGRVVMALAPPFDGGQASLVALLSDGAAWSTSALALALGASQRTVQRALAELEAAGRVRSTGRARSQRWLAPTLAGFTTILLLPINASG